ncbi:hypothetical protein [Hamadaea tsunoensis]|uniref:hypothetical protein n=1 Tax=Hamadaea tsunoensis TaxID=53368 RepID=UPI0012F94B1B|nr:hypothetical protein [Hamadaea tsunoensis]
MVEQLGEDFLAGRPSIQQVVHGCVDVERRGRCRSVERDLRAEQSLVHVPALPGAQFRAFGDGRVQLGDPFIGDAGTDPVPQLLPGDQPRSGHLGVQTVAVDLMVDARLVGQRPGEVAGVARLDQLRPQLRVGGGVAVGVDEDEQRVQLECGPHRHVRLRRVDPAGRAAARSRRPGNRRIPSSRHIQQELRTGIRWRYRLAPYGRAVGHLRRESALLGRRLPLEGSPRLRPQCPGVGQPGQFCPAEVPVDGACEWLLPVPGVPGTQHDPIAGLIGAALGHAAADTTVGEPAHRVVERPHVRGPVVHPGLAQLLGPFCETRQPAGSQQLPPPLVDLRVEIALPGIYLIGVAAGNAGQSPQCLRRVEAPVR